MAKKSKKTKKIEKKQGHTAELVVLGIALVGILFLLGLKSAVSGKKAVESTPIAPYTSSEGKYTVSFSSSPYIEEHDIALGGAGKIEKWTVAKSEEGGKTFLVGFVNTPPDYKLASDSGALEQMAKLIITLDSPNASSNPLSTKDLTYQGVPAVEYTFKNEDGKKISKYRTFYVGTIIYYIGEKSTKDNFAEFDEFVNSLQISK